MSRLGFNTQILSRCGGAWLRASPVVAPMGTSMAVPLCHSVRHVSTTRPKKAQAMKESSKETAVAAPTPKAPKASVSTKSKKSPTKAATAAATALEKEVKATTQAKKTEVTKAKASKTKATSSAKAEPKPRVAVKTTTTAKSDPAPASKAPASTSNTSTPKAESPEPAIASMSAAKKQSTATGSARSTPSQQYTAPKTTPVNASVSPRPSSAPIPPPRPSQTRLSDQSKPIVDTSSPEYKQAQWKWTSTMIALPILLVTSYVLFDRLALGNQPDLERIREKIRGVTGSGGTEAAASGVDVQTNNTA